MTISEYQEQRPAVQELPEESGERETEVEFSLVHRVYCGLVHNS